MTGTLPDVVLDQIVSLPDFEPLAKQRMEPAAFDYVAGGSWDEITLAENELSWQEFRFVPRVLRDVRSVDVGGSFLGRRSALPVAVAPMAAQGLAHAEGEVPALQAAAAAGIPFCLSTSSSRTLEDVAAAAPEAERWFQLYLVDDLDYSRSLVERAAAAGYRAIVLTVDLPVLAYRERDRRSGLVLPPLPHIDGAPHGRGGRYRGLDAQNTIGLSWANVADMREWTNLPFILKGILSADDARLAADAGVAAICVSNHGARQLDRSVTSADVLEEIVEAVDGRCEVWADGGIRRGLDIATAIALGADGVLVGRPLYWALATAGQAGVERAIAILKEELRLALVLLGCASIADLSPDLIR